MKYVVEEWQTDITKYQLPAIIGGVGPLHYVTQFGNQLILSNVFDESLLSMFIMFTDDCTFLSS